jgi:hypothetical protein
MNLLFCTAPCNVYAFLTTEVYPDTFAPFPPRVADVPNYTARTNNNNHATAKATHAREKKTRADIITMNTALADVFLKAMLVQVRAFQQRRLREPNIVFVDIFLWFVKQYSTTTAEDCKANQQHMAANWHPPKGFDALILRLFTGAAFASSAGCKMNDLDIVDIGLRIIKQCGMYGEEYKAWIARKVICPHIVEMFDTFKMFWAAKNMLVNQTVIPTGLHGYGMAAMNDDDSIVSYGESIVNFGAAYAATQELVKAQGTTIALVQGQLQVMQ